MGLASLGFPNCVGAVSGAHIAILSPVHHGHKFISWKGYILIMLQAVDPLVTGDSTYSLHPWLMQPFAGCLEGIV